MALRSSSPAVPPERNDSETLGSAHSGHVHPDTAEKKWSAGLAAVAIVASMFLPWWLTSYPIRNDAESLSGWQLLGLGLGMGDWAPQTGFSAFGNVLWGVLPTISALVLAVLLVLRAVRPRTLPANIIALWAVFTLVCQLWLVVLGWVRLDTTFGEFPTLWGMLPATMATVFSAITLFGWWRRGERGLWPSRTRRGAAAESEDALQALLPNEDAPETAADFGARDENAPSSR